MTNEQREWLEFLANTPNGENAPRPPGHVGPYNECTLLRELARIIISLDLEK